MDTVVSAAPFATLVRFLWLAGLMGAVGAGVFHLRVVAEARRAGAAEISLGAASRRALAVLRAAAVWLALMVPMRLTASDAMRSGGPGAWFATAPGAGWLLQAAATVLLLGATVTARPAGSRGWAPAAVGAALLCLAPALSGHALEAEALRPLAVLSDALHVFAAGAWLGGLAVLLLALGAIGRAGGDRYADGARLARAFSPLALAGAATVVATGVLRSLFHVGSAAELWRTVYGNTLTFKVAVAMVVLLAGLYNWRKALPRLGTRRAEDAFRRTATLELVVATVVLLLTAVLVALPLP